MQGRFRQNNREKENKSGTEGSARPEVKREGGGQKERDKPRDAHRSS